MLNDLLRIEKNYQRGILSECEATAKANELIDELGGFQGIARLSGLAARLIRQRLRPWLIAASYHCKGAEAEAAWIEHHGVEARHISIVEDYPTYKWDLKHIPIRD